MLKNLIIHLWENKLYNLTGISNLYNHHLLSNKRVFFYLFFNVDALTLLWYANMLMNY